MIELMNDVSGLVEKHYRAYLLQLAGIYANIMDQPAPTAPASRTKFGEQAQLAQTIMLSSVAQKIDQAAANLVEEALSAAHPGIGEAQTSQVSQIVHEARNDLIGQITLASQKDTGQVTQALRQFALMVDEMMSVKGTSYVAAIINAKIALGENWTFIQTDRIGRRWASTVYAKSAARGFLVKTYVDTYVYGLAARGQDLARVVHPEAGHPHADMVFSISGKSEQHPTYTSIKDQVWHPNSRALIASA